MTAQEAIKDIVENGIELGAGDYVNVEALKVAILALEKQIPCKLAPKSSKKAELPVCGKCNGIMDLMQGELNYCPNCGKKIDWSDRK